jgi:hypothetical protein
MLELPTLNLQENAPSNDNIIVEIQSVEELPDPIINNDQNSILNPVSLNDIPIDQETIQVMNQNSVISVNLDNIVVDENADNNDDSFLM